MPRPKTISDEEILRVARSCFQEHGHSVSTRDIARAAGISQSVLYQRFGGKEAMFLRAMIPEPPDIGALLDRPDGLSSRDYVELILQRLIVHFQGLVPALMHLMTYPNFDLSHMGEAHEHLMADTLQGALTERFQAMVVSGEIAEHSGEALATAVIGLAHTIGMHATIRGGAAPGSHNLSAIVDVFWRGMTPTGA